MTSPTNSPGIDVNGQGSSQIASGYSYQSEVESASGTSVMPYFFTVWLIFLSLIVALVYLVLLNRRKRQEPQQQQSQEDVEAKEQVATTNFDASTIITERKKMIQRGGLTIMIIGTIVGLVLSFFTILTCEFLSLDLDVELRGSLFEEPVPATIYSLGLWSFDYDGVEEQCAPTSLFLLLDWKFELARAAAVISILLGGVCLLMLIVCCVKPNFREYIDHLSWFFLLTTIFQLLTLCLFESSYCSASNNCSGSLGAMTSITAVLYWLYVLFAASLLPFRKTTTSIAPSTPEVYVVDAY